MPGQGHVGGRYKQRGSRVTAVENGQSEATSETTPLARPGNPVNGHYNGAHIAGRLEHTRSGNPMNEHDNGVHIASSLEYPRRIESISGWEHGSSHVAEPSSSAKSSGGSSNVFSSRAMSTEDEIRRRFVFQPPSGWSAEKMAACIRGKMTETVGSPKAILYSVFPVLRELGTYDCEALTRDAMVGTTMATMMIPQGLTFAAIAGIPVLYGLYMVWLPPLVYGMFGNSVHVSYGAFALTGLFLTDALGKRGYKPCPGLCHYDDRNPEEYLEACSIVTLMVGLWYVILSFIKVAEPLAILLADPVVDGFITASSILLVSSQVFIFLQIPPPLGSGTSVVAALMNAWTHRDSINWIAVAVGMTSIAVYFALRRYNSHLKSSGVTNFFLPEALLVVVIFTFFSWAVDLHGAYGVEIVGPIPQGLPTPTPPRLDKLSSLEEVQDMAGIAFIAAIIGFVCTHTIAKSLAGTKEIAASKELFAYGAANLAGSLFFCLPCGGSLSRAGIIDSLGGRTVIHNVFTFILMSIVLLFCSSLLEFLPTPVLVGAVYAVLYKFLGVQEPLRLLRVGWLDLLMWVTMFCSTLGFGMIPGMVVGVAASALTLIQRSLSPSIVIMGRLPGTDMFRDIKSYPDAHKIPGVEVMRFGAPLTFANKDRFRQAVIELVEQSMNEGYLARDRVPGPPLQFLVLDSSSIHDMDSSSIKMLEVLVSSLLKNQASVEILLALVGASLMYQIQQSPKLSKTLGRRFFLGVAPAVRYASGQVAERMLMELSSIQTNGGHTNGIPSDGAHEMENI